MQFRTVFLLVAAGIIAGCGTPGEKKAPCPPLSAYAADGTCGEALPINAGVAATQTIVKED